MSGFFEKGESSQSATRDVTIPEFLRPFLTQSATTGSGALQNLQNLSGRDLVAGFTPDQQAAFQRVRDIAGGGGGFLPTAQNTLLSAARGQGLNFLPGIAMDEFGEAIDGEFLPAESRAVLERLTRGSDLPGTDTLSRTAAGDFLFGGEGSDAAIEAAVRAARPGILSTFGSSVGGGTGALSQAAIGQSAVDAFARQFAQERANQLGAAETLGSLGLAGRGQQLGALGQLADIGRGESSLGLSAAGLLGDFASTERGRQLTAAGALPGLAFSGVEPLLNIGNIQQQQQQRELGAPFDLQLQLLGAALGVPGSFAPLFGEDATGEGSTRGFRLNFGQEGGSLASLLGI